MDSARAPGRATTHIDRKAFGLTWNQALESGGLLVGERIDIHIDAQVVAAPSEQQAA
ncbi:YceI family protein [Myxococcus sp. 1LA]